MFSRLIIYFLKFIELFDHFDINSSINYVIDSNHLRIALFDQKSYVFNFYIIY